MSNRDFSHGDDGYKYNSRIVADFSSNVWKDGTPAALTEHLKTRLGLISNYPQIHAESLTEAYARYHKCAHSQVLVTNGTAEAIFLIAQYFRDKKSEIVIPSFSEYEHACTIYNHTINYKLIDSLTETTATDEGLFWICNPNNPTGHCFDSSFILNIARSNPQTLFIVDEAYTELCINGDSITNHLSTAENIIVLRSMTKHFTIPGLRLGYIAGNEKFISGIASFQPPWSVNSLAIEAGLFLIDNQQQIDVEKWINESQELRRTIAEITGWEAYPSAAAYFLMKTTIPSAQIKRELIEQHGILIRDASNFRGLDDFHIRICSQTSAKNQKLVDALIDNFKK